MNSPFILRNWTTFALAVVLFVNFVLVYKWPTEVNKPISNCDCGSNTCRQFVPKNAPSLALVIPFPERFAVRVINNMKVLWTKFSPCTESLQGVDLIFYTNFERNEQVEKEIRTALEATPQVAKCFNKVGFFHASLNATEDAYPHGPNNMFCRMFNQEILWDYDYIFYMEQDTRPIRSNWLPLVIEHISGPEKFWIKGSAYFGHRFIPQEFYYCRACFFHINGNALYGIGDAEFRKLSIEICDEVSKTGEHYDQRLAKFWTEDYNTWNYTKMRFHKVVFSNFLQNWWATDFDYEQLVRNSPETYFIHGGDARNKPREWYP